MDKQITVRELIDKLLEWPQDWVIKVEDDKLSEIFTVTGVYGYDEGEVGLNIE